MCMKVDWTRTLAHRDGDGESGREKNKLAMAATTAAGATALATGVAATAGVEAARLQSLATTAAVAFPKFLRSQERTLGISATAAKFPTNLFPNNSHSLSIDNRAARRSLSSALQAMSPDSQNSPSATAPPPPPPSEKDDEQQVPEPTSDPAQDEASTAAKEWATKAPQRFHVRSGQLFNILGASVGALLRVGTGVFIQGYKLNLVPVADFPADKYASFEVAGRKTLETGTPGPNKPELPIELYEFEGCPFCRKVREIVSILDLDVLFYPTPKDGPNFRPKAIQLGGKRQFPYMVDPNTGVSMYESDAIIKYLVEKYGNGKVPISLSLGPITTITAGFAMLGRAGKGSQYTPSRLPAEPLKLWAYEVSPFSKLVREKLVELELPHYYYSTPRGSTKRDELLQRTGHFQVPYLEDPNTGVKMFESADIVEYLEQTYAISESPKVA